MISFFDATRLTHNYLSGFPGLRAESEANETQKRKRRTYCLQEERMQTINNSFPKEIPCLLYLLIISKKNDNRYERVQKIDPRNTLRGMKTKETIFLK